MAVADIVDKNTPMTLVVAWRTGKKAHGRRIDIAGDVLEAFIDAVNDARAAVNEPNGRDYDPDDEQDDAPYVHAARDEAWDLALLNELLRGRNLNEADATDLKQRFACYALVVGPSESPTLYVRKMNPVALATKPIIGRFFNHAVSRVEEPLLAFDASFDVVVTSDALYALNQKRFEGLFRESDAVLARAGEWVGELDQVLPLAEGSVDYLTDAVKRNSVTRRKLTSILKRPYFAALTEDVVREKIEAHGFNVDAIFPEGKLNFIDETSTRELMWILNQDVYSGDFTGETFAAGSKRRL